LSARIAPLLAALPLLAPAGAAREPRFEAGLIFPPGYLHSHASCIVECPNRDLLACWYVGSGERRADDVAVVGARKRAGARAWSEPFPMADTPGFPDCNPCMVIGPDGVLRLFWVTIQANEWHTALLKCRTSRDYQRRSGAPRWSAEQVIHLKPGEEFTRRVREAVEQDLARLDRYPEAARPLLREYLERRARNAGDRYFNRLGWMPRAHPFVLDRQRLLLPLYSDGFDFSLMALSGDGGQTWDVSLPLVGEGPVQPSLVRRRDGALAAYFRDNGLPPKRLLYSESRDDGRTWTPPRDTEIPNPGAGVEVRGLRDGRWLLVNNDTERGRHSLAVSLSDDEGRTWRWTRHVERDEPGPLAGGYSYPSVIQARDGSIHLTYSHSLPAARAEKDAAGRPLRESIKHVRFDLEWVTQQRRDAR